MCHADPFHSSMTALKLIPLAGTLDSPTAHAWVGDATKSDPVAMTGRHAAGLAGQPVRKPGFACTATGAAAGLRELPGWPESDRRPQGACMPGFPNWPATLEAAADRRSGSGVPEIVGDGQCLAP